MPQNTFSTSQQYFLGGLFWMVEKVRWVQNTLLQFCMHLWSDVPTKEFSPSASVTYNYFYVYKQVKRERERLWTKIILAITLIFLKLACFNKSYKLTKCLTGSSRLRLNLNSSRFWFLHFLNNSSTNWIIHLLTLLSFWALYNCLSLGMGIVCAWEWLLGHDGQRPVGKFGIGEIRELSDSP